jgi:hypothetical protein
VESKWAIIMGGVALGIEPAVRGQMLADFFLEVDLFVQALACS